SQLEAKVVILGMQGVGKTSIVHRYTTGSFSYSLTSTIGASFCTKKLSVDGCKVRLQIWDTAGQERFRSMAPMYYRGANAAILVYDLTNQESFSDIQNWIDELRQNMTSDLIIQIVGSKADLAHDRRAVDLDEAYQNILKWTSSSSSLTTPFNNINSFSNFQQNRNANQQHTQSTSPHFRFSLTDDDQTWNSVGITEVSAKDDIGESLV
ncbi:rab GTPase, partial [Phakopsora pachyrhizi]